MTAAPRNRTQRLLRKIILITENCATASFSAWLKANFDNWVKLNGIQSDDTLPNLLASGGADDTLSSGNVVKINGNNYIDGYAAIGITTLTINSKTYFMSFVPSAYDIGTNASYMFQCHIDANNRIDQRFTSTNNAQVFKYLGASVDETVTVTDLYIENKEYFTHAMIPSTTEDILYYVNGLLRGSITIANDVVGTDIDSVSNAIGATNHSTGASAFGGYLSELAISDNEEIYYTIRKQALHAMGYSNPLGYHNAYGVLGDGVNAYLQVPADASINDHFSGGGAIAFEGMMTSHNSYPQMVNKSVWATSGYHFFCNNTVSNNKVQIQFRHWFNSGGTAALWGTTDHVLEINEPFVFIVDYDRDNIANNPTFTLIQNGTITDYTVGSGLSEWTTPVGSADSDSSDDLYILTDNAAVNPFDGYVSQLAYLPSGSAPTALYQDWSGLSPVAYWKMGDHIDSLTLDRFADMAVTYGGILDAANAEHTVLYEDNFDDLANGTDVTTQAEWFEYGTVTNRDIQDGRLRVTTSTSSTGVRLSLTTVAGQAYELSFKSTGTAAENDLYIETGTNSFDYDETNREHFHVFIADATTTNIYWRANGNFPGENRYWDIRILTLGGNPAIAGNMDDDNLIEVRPNNYETYYASIQSIASFDHLLYGYGASMRNYGTSNDYGTNTANNGYDYIGNNLTAFDASTSYIDLEGGGLITGSVPATYTMFFELQFDDPADNTLQNIMRGFIDANYDIQFYKSSGNIIVYTHKANGGSNFLNYDVSGDYGVHQVVVVANGTDIALYFDGVLQDSEGSGDGVEAMSGTLSTFILGAATTTPTQVFDGDLSIFGWKESALTADQISSIYNLKGRP